MPQQRIFGPSMLPDTFSRFVAWRVENKKVFFIRFLMTLVFCRSTNLKVIAGLVFFPYIFWLDFKSKEELMLQPQTVSEHEHDMQDTSSDESLPNINSDNESSSEDESWNSSEDDARLQIPPPNRKESKVSRKGSTASEHSHYGTVRAILLC